jgi:hypothetical protein
MSNVLHSPKTKLRQSLKEAKLILIVVIEMGSVMNLMIPRVQQEAITLL